MVSWNPLPGPTPPLHTRPAIHWTSAAWRKGNIVVLGAVGRGWVGRCCQVESETVTRGANLRLATPFLRPLCDADRV